MSETGFLLSVVFSTANKHLRLYFLRVKQSGMTFSAHNIEFRYRVEIRDDEARRAVA